MLSAARAGVCSDDGLGYFAQFGVAKAHARFHELLEEPHCRAEPEFMVNLGQIYKASSNDPINACRAVLAYRDAQEIFGLEAVYARVASEGIRSTDSNCKVLDMENANDEYFILKLMQDTKQMESTGQPHLALREYRLLMYLRPSDPRPFNGFCKLARRIGDRRSINHCEKHMHTSEVLTAASGASSSALPWTFTSLSVVLAGLAIWKGIELHSNYTRAWDAHRDMQAIVNMSPRLSVDEEVIAISYKNHVLNMASKNAENAQVWMWVSAGASVGFAWAASSIWMSADGEGMVFSPDGSLTFKSAF